MPTLEEKIADQVAFEYANLKRRGFIRIDFSQLIMNAINVSGAGKQEDLEGISRLRREVAKIMAQRRKARKEANKQHWASILSND